ncbi:iron transport multicopper oxidase fetC-like isoform X1 [Bombus pyrosoma]|uniref:iron transport multicopper oxidase fetC-like isoform X1 n=1 Tax=Bombus pyrosoma TaxID=396416 RepID=UPI001CB9B7E5|nr:iron transport multicopper oxidase fetC-like isoform X1 [Bombus pyrosoma]
MENAATGMEVTIHWHGIFQNGFQYYDSVPYVTQFPIASSSTFSSGQTIYKENVQNDYTEPCTCPDVINATLNNIVELVIYDEVLLPGLYHPFHLPVMNLEYLVWRILMVEIFRDQI